MKISGQGMKRKPAQYGKKTRQGWNIDIAAIEEKINGYIAGAEGSNRYSYSGLCIALGVQRETFEIWKSGYVCQEDEQDKRTLPNPNLTASLVRGELFIHRYWEESEKSTTLHTRLLESAGLLTQKQAKLKPPFDLGSLKKHSR